LIVIDALEQNFGEAGDLEVDLIDALAPGARNAILRAVGLGVKLTLTPLNPTCQWYSSTPGASTACDRTVMLAAGPPPVWWGRSPG